MIRHGLTLDWLSAIFADNDGYRLWHELGGGGHAGETDATPTKGYNHARRLESGLKLCWNSNRADMGVQLLWTGSALRWYAERGVTWKWLIDKVAEFHGRTSRVDVAIDVYDSGLQAVDVCKSKLRAYKGKGRTPRFLEMQSDHNGWTRYIGSRSSEKMLRIYNKASELGLYDQDIIRIELECKGMTAHAVGHEFAKMSVADCEAMSKTLIRTVADFNLSGWDIVMTSPALVLAVPKRTDSDTLRWLVEACAPSLAREIARRPHEDVLDQFHAALQAALREHGLQMI